MSISEQYKLKTLAILNIESIIGRILLRKIVIQFGSEVNKIIIIDTHTRTTKINSNKLIQQLFKQDSFFKGINFQFIKNKIQVWEWNMNMNQQNNKINEKTQKIKVDILFNCYVPQDFTRNTIQTFLNSHVWMTKRICKHLLNRLNISKLIGLSSIYSQNHGFVTESDGQISTQPLGYNPQNMATPEKLKQDLSDIFTSQYEIWQWSVLNMESIFTLQSGAKKVQIVRVPSLGPSLSNYEGYLLNFNTLSSLVYEIGMKKIDVLQGNSHSIIDMIPADFVSHYLLVIAVKIINTSKVIIQYDINSQDLPEKLSPEKLQIQNQSSTKNIKKYQIIVHNLSTSSRNPISLAKFGNYIAQAWIEYSSQDYKPIKFKVHEKKWERKAYAIKNKLPIQAKARLAYLFDIKSWKIQTQQDSITSMKKFETIRKFRFFIEHEWICQSNKSIDYFFSLSSEDQVKFNFNVNTINWKVYAKLYCYAISKYLLGVQVEKFNPASLDLLNLQRSSYFSDIVWALTQGKPVNAHDSIEMKRYILSTKSVKQAIEQLVQQQSKKLQQTPTAYQKVYQQFYKVADEMCTQMFSQYSMNSIRGFAWFLHKVFRVIYQKVVVDKIAIMKLRNHDEKTNGPLIIIPTHRSYIDFLIMSYVFFGYGIKVPHIAAAEDFLNMAVVHILLRKSGAFFIKRDQKKYRNLYKAVMSQYISKLLVQNHYLEFFIEGTRCRVGKMLQPKYGILSIIAKNVMDGKIPDAQIMPVTINYEKVLEGNSFTYQLMGQAKVKQSLSRLLKAVDVLKQNYGRIYIQLCQPIPVKKYFVQNLPKYIDKPTQNFQLVLNDLGYKIVYQLTDKLVITPPAILSSVMLMDRIGISDDKLSEKVQWLSREITSRGIKVARTQSDSSISVNNTLALMGDIVNKSKKDMFEVQVTFDQNSFMQLFTLTYNRNTLTHIFFEEGLITVSMASFGYQDLINCKIPLQQLKKSVIFLGQLLNRQYVLQQYITDYPNRFDEIIQQMASRSIIQLRIQQDQNKNKITYVGIINPDSNIFVFECSLIWPIVQSYWICILYYFKLIKDNNAIDLKKLQSQIQWFGQSIFTERIILHLQAISMDTIKNATATFKSMKVIGQSKQSSGFMKVLFDQTSLKNLQRRIQTYLKSKYANSFKGTLGNGRGSVALDFPFLSKL